jgi:hypothetical protein
MLTIAQDGSAMFTTIQTARDAQKKRTGGADAGQGKTGR